MQEVYYPVEKPQVETDFLRSATHRRLKMFAEVINSCLREGTFLEEWKYGKTGPLEKGTQAIKTFVFI